jgi:ankyrin repeat protein
MELTEFERAVVENDLPVITRFLDDDPGLVNRAGYKDLPVIELAVSRSSAEVVEFLIHRGAVLNRCCGFSGATALHQAVARDRKETVAVLLRHGADLTLKDNEGFTAYDEAVALGRTEIAEMLRAAQKE